MDDLGIFEKAASLLEAGQNVALLTVTATTGSAPGKAGYKMLVWAPEGRTLGTVGGGLNESEMIRLAEKMLAEPSSEVRQFELTGGPEEERGICGGSIEFLVESFDGRWQPLFDALTAGAGGGEEVVLVSTIEAGKPPRKVLLKSPFRTEGAHEDFRPEVISLAREAAGQQGSKRVSIGGKEFFIESVARRPAVIIFGAGHLSGHISRYAASVGFAVTVCDERAEYANKERFPEADDIIVESFERVFDRLHVDGNSYIVIVTRGHKCDEIVLERAVGTDAGYIGMIGSRRKTRTIMERLHLKGIAPEALKRVYSPIGVSIGAVTPEEISLSIVCELVKIRRLGPVSEAGHMTLSF